MRPESTAVVCEREHLTYRELAHSSSCLATYLQHLGGTPDSCIGVFVEPSLELMIGVWGVLFSACAYLPLSPEYPEERLQYMIEDARVSIVFTQKNLKAKLEALAPIGTRIITLDDAMDFTAIHGITDRHNLGEELLHDDLAYIIYTSGSTGKPKGVMIEHHSIVNQMQWLRTEHQLNHTSRVLQKTPMSFDAAQWEILAPTCGSTVVIGSPGIYKDPEALIKVIKRHQVTKLQCVPTLMQALIDTDEFHECVSLTQIFSGGEILSKRLARECLDTLPTCDLINLYGPTECTINASAHKLDRQTVDDGPNAISIGKPVLNTRFYILDENRKPVAPGQIGELYVGGVQLARGYLHRQDLTDDRFVENPYAAADRSANLYKTGDLAYINEDGDTQFAGRSDNQIKLRGYRVELDEIRLAIEAHDWVKNASMIIKDDACTGFQNLIGCIELNPREAALMDQGNHGSHHQSKENRLQVKAQLSNIGCRDEDEVDGKLIVALPGKEPTAEQRRLVFARKTYRFFEGGAVTRADISQLLTRPVMGVGARKINSVSLDELGEILRYFGQFHSTERLLPKYGFASPGSLYATQMYFELHNIGGLTSGYYYYDPVEHQLVLINPAPTSKNTHIKVHFIGKKRAIEPIYKNNIQEVLEIETGHMLGLFDNVLPAYRLSIGSSPFTPAVKGMLECAEEDYYLGSFVLQSGDAARPDDTLDIYVQSHPGKIDDLPEGQYSFKEGHFSKISDDIILKKHVIAINQQVYENSSFGISMISREPQEWMRYIALGRKLQHLQMNDLNLGFMSSGYSSKSGNDLPSAKRMASIIAPSGKVTNPFYFCIGGLISDEQRDSEGMKEDTVHMSGPKEMIKESLHSLLPHYMVPNRIVIFDTLPLSANGKVDHKALAASDEVNAEAEDRPFVAPRTQTEERIGAIWKRAMKWTAVSVQHDFFESGGNSLIAVSLINKINKEFQCTLPLQVLFEAPTIEELARKVDGEDATSDSRLVRLQSSGNKHPVYCWPGLGGYPMNLRSLASKIAIERPFYGVQAHGINHDETPFPTIKEMAAADIQSIKHIQPTGPYTLWGYSFGARVAFEVAHQLEKAGDQVENVFLIAPGSPKVRAQDEAIYGNAPSYDNKAFVTILFSVFARSISGPELEECLEVTKDEESFSAFICAHYKRLDPDLVKRIIRIVRQTYEFKYTFGELSERQIKAPLTIFKAEGDDYSFIENSTGYSVTEPTVFDLNTDHYSMLKTDGIDELVKCIHQRMRAADLHDAHKQTPSSE